MSCIKCLDSVGVSVALFVCGGSVSTLAYVSNFRMRTPTALPTSPYSLNFSRMTLLSLDLIHVNLHLWDEAVPDRVDDHQSQRPSDTSFLQGRADVMSCATRRTGSVKTWTSDGARLACEDY